jgi:hypothetical protein
LDRARGILFLVIAAISGYLMSNAIQERVGHVHTSVDWLGGTLTCSIGMALDLAYRYKWGLRDGASRYFLSGGGSIWIPFWCLALIGLVASLGVFVSGGLTW